MKSTAETTFTFRHKIVPQIALLALFGKFIHSSDKEATGKGLEAITHTDNEYILAAVNEWPALDMLIQMYENPEHVGDEIDDPKEDEEAFARLAVSALLQELGGVIGLNTLRRRFAEARSKVAMDIMGIEQHDITVEKPAVAGMLHVGKDSEGRDVFTAEIRCASEEDGKRKLAEMEAAGVRFVTINNAEELDTLDIPEEAKNQARSILLSGIAKGPIKIGITPDQFDVRKHFGAKLPKTH